MFQPFTPKWNLRRLASLNFLDISESSQGLEARQKHIIFCYTSKTRNDSLINGSFQFYGGTGDNLEEIICIQLTVISMRICGLFWVYAYNLERKLSWKPNSIEIQYQLRSTYSA